MIDLLYDLSILDDIANVGRIHISLGSELHIEKQMHTHIKVKDAHPALFLVCYYLGKTFSVSDYPFIVRFFHH